MLYVILAIFAALAIITHVFGWVEFRPRPKGGELIQLVLGAVALSVLIGVCMWLVL